MKLYTEEQVKKMIDLAIFTYNSEDKILLSQIPIEIPSDGEIEKAANSQSHYEGAMWLKYAILMRDKIQRDNK
jgi:hypothetical protein